MSVNFDHHAPGCYRRTDTHAECICTALRNETTRRLEAADFQQWLQAGIDAGFVSAPYCSSHDGEPATAEEIAAWDDSDDVCTFSLRLVPQGASWADLQGGRQLYGEWAPTPAEQTLQ